MIPVMIVPVLIRHDLLERMIKSINYPIRDLVIIDNGPQFNYEPSWSAWVHKVHHIKIPYNLGVASSWNLGIKSMPYSDYWLITGFDNEWEGESLAEFQKESDPNKLVLSNASPNWTAFTIGWKVVDKVGLFDEALHPAYFEDNDYEWRCGFSDVQIVQSFITFPHDNSSTLKAGFQNVNNRTFLNNLLYFEEKRERKAPTEGGWSIRRRRANGWE